MEYEEFNQAEEKLRYKKGMDRYFFFVTEESLEDAKPAFFANSYQEWYDHISRKKYFSLYKYKKNPGGLKLEIREVANEIIERRNCLVSQVIDLEYTKLHTMVSD